MRRLVSRPRRKTDQARRDEAYDARIEMPSRSASISTGARTRSRRRRIDHHTIGATKSPVSNDSPRSRRRKTTGSPRSANAMIETTTAKVPTDSATGEPRDTAIALAIRSPVVGRVVKTTRGGSAWLGTSVTRRAMQIGVRRDDVHERVDRIVLLGDVPLHAGGPARGDDRREVEGPLPCRGVGERRTWATVLHVQRPDPAGVGPDERGWVLAAACRPVDVDLEVDVRREIAEEHIPDPGAVERREFEGVVVIAEPDPVSREPGSKAIQLGGESADIVGRDPVGLGHERDDDAWAPEHPRPGDRGLRVRPQAFDALVDGDHLEPGIAEQAREGLWRRLGQARDLDPSIPGAGHRVEGRRAGRPRPDGGPCRAGGRSGRHASAHDRPSGPGRMP